MADSSPEPSLFVGSNEYDRSSSYDGHISHGDLDDDSDDVQIMANGGDSPGASPPIYLDDDLFVPEPLSDDQSPHQRYARSPSNHSSYRSAAGSLAPSSPAPEALDLQNQRANRPDVVYARDMALGLPGVLGDLNWMGDIDSEFDFDAIEDLEAELEAQNHHIRQPIRRSQTAAGPANDGGRMSEENGFRRSAMRPPNRNPTRRPFSPVHLPDSDDDDFGIIHGLRDNNRDVLVDVELPDGRHHAPPALPRQQPRQSGAAEVIDLTNEPDSPVRAHARPVSQNIRRQNSQARNPPAFARSDSSILGGAPVIDLTDDAPDRSALPALPGLPRRPPRQALHSPELLFLNQRPVPRPHQHNRNEASRDVRHRTRQAHLLHGLRRNFMHHLPFLNLFNPDPADANLDLVEGMMGNPFNPVGHIQLQYQHGAFDRRPPSPKPVHVPPPPAQPGFSRDTKADSSSAYVCPACNEELAYDPLETASASDAQPSRSTRLGKRPRSEHHFWALKGCGHVYCEDCYENRKPTSKRPNTGFLHGGRDHKLSCAVEGCDTQVTNKGSWVGIYL